MEARVIGVRPDGVLNMSLKPRSYEMINDDAAMILTMLQRNSDHKLPFGTNLLQKKSKKLLA